MNKALKDLIKEQLVVDEQEVVSKVLPRLKKFLGFTKNGKILLLVDRSRLPKIYHVLLYLLGKRLAYIAELTDSPDASIKEVSKELGFPENYTRALLSELLSKGLIERGDVGLYHIKLVRLEELTSIIESKLGKVGDEQKP